MLNNFRHHAGVGNTEFTFRQLASGTLLYEEPELDIRTSCLVGTAFQRWRFGVEGHGSLSVLNETGLSFPVFQL